MLSVTRKQYEKIRSEKMISLNKRTDLPLEHGSIILIYLKDVKKLVAEYDIDKIEKVKSKERLIVEPIYNSPDGLLVTDLILLTLTSNDLKTWKKLLKSQIFPISDSDFFELSGRLKN